MLWPERFGRQPPPPKAEPLTPPLTQKPANAPPGPALAGEGPHRDLCQDSRLDCPLVVVKCRAKGRLKDCLDREELIRKRAIFRVVLTQGVSEGCAEGRIACMEFEVDAVRLSDVEELDELAPKAVHLLDVVF